MSVKLYVAGLGAETTNDELRSLFEVYGTVIRATAWWDFEECVCKGWGLVEMEDDCEAQFAIDALNGRMRDGKQLKVAHHRPKESRFFAVHK